MESITKKDAQKWANALRSGKYSQTKHMLNDVIGRHCCLGVACEIFIPENKKRYKSERLYGSVPNEQPNAPQWLKNINDDLENKTGEKFETLNDYKDFFFDEIADVIELVYVHKALN
jgi:hypothetical protein